MADEKKIKDEEENAEEMENGEAGNNEAPRDEAENDVTRDHDGESDADGGQKQAEMKSNEKAEEEKPDYEHKYKRALADYQNLLKRAAAEKSECARYANENLFMEILPVYDNLKLALKHAACKDGKGEKNDNGIEKGIEYVIRQFKNILEAEGVKEIETAGKKYDHAVMEAIGHKETDDKKADGIVAEELKAGYTLNGRVIIPARVTVFEYKHNT